MTDENLLNISLHDIIILGFAQGTNNYSFDYMYVRDARTQFLGGDDIYLHISDSYHMPPSSLETNTIGNYNEIVINTLTMNKNGQIVKMQPDYIVYIKQKSDLELDELENDLVWQNSKKAASEFGIPIVVIDREKVREYEKEKIVKMSKEISDSRCMVPLMSPPEPRNSMPLPPPPPTMPPPPPPTMQPLPEPPNTSILSISTTDKILDSNDIKKFIKKVIHYIHRYGRESILEYLPENEREFLIVCKKHDLSLDHMEEFLEMYLECSPEEKMKFIREYDNILFEKDPEKERKLFEKYIKEKRVEKKRGILVSDTRNKRREKQTTDNRVDILRRQDELKKKIGEER